MEKEARILAGNLSSVFNIDGRQHYRFLENKRSHINALVENILLHDRIFIPIQDYSSPIALVKIFGEKPIIDLLENNRIKFLRTKGVIGFVRGTGSDGGIAVIKSADPHTKADSANRDRSIDMGFSEFHPSSSERKLISRLLEDNTIELKLEDLIERVRKESAEDVKQSSLWRSSFEFDSEKGLFQFPNTEKMQVRTFGPGFKPSAVITDYYLLSVLTNLEVTLANEFECNGVSTNQPSGLILKRKIERVLKHSVDLDGYLTLQTLADIPDLGELVSAQPLRMRDLVKLTEKNDAKQFRKWFHEHSGKLDIELAKAYIQLLKSEQWVEKTPVKLLRFVLSTFSTSNPIWAPLIGFADSFFVQKFVRGSSPKYFIEKLSQFKHWK